MTRAAIALALALAVLAACAGRDASKSETEKATPSSIKTGVARIGQVPLTVSAYGAISGGPNAQASLAFPEPGRIASIEATVGERVTAGQALAQLDPAPFDAAVAQAQANVHAAQAEYSKAAAGARPQQRAQTSAQIEQARTQFSVAQAQYDRQAQLLRIGLASQADLDAANAALASARSQLRVLQEQQSAQIHPLAQDVASARAQLEQADAALQSARQARAYATLTAPFAGVVTARLHSAGESVDSADAVIQLANDQVPTFTAAFDPRDAARIHVGDAASIRFSDSGSSTSGTVTAINFSQTSEGRQVAVLIRLRSASGDATPGAYGQASVRVGTGRGLLVPASAIVQDPATGSTLVFRKTGDHFNPIPVKVNAAFGNAQWVSSDQLHANDVIVVRGAAELMTAPQGGDEGGS
ncbi:MAG TPA: HlyD family efflux transporter periplasmic adaptor subunit [Candidatus Baltobacteraceae bacterium]|nr:HlyD family efflux transporter periplasmic adaptor subunit [Candidatus Baltobacteraceae bacterium]